MATECLLGTPIACIKGFCKKFLNKKGYWCTFRGSRRDINMLLLTTYLVAPIAGANVVNLLDVVGNWT
jgi:hypothetical protein